MPGTIVDGLHGFALPSAGSDARRADEGALAGEPQRRGIGQGPRRGDDDWAWADQRWYWTGRKFETDLDGRTVPQVVPKVNAAVAAALAQPAAPLEPPPSAKPKRA